MRSGECRYYLQQIPHAGHGEHETRDKEKMIVAGKNMSNAVSCERSSHGALIQP